MASVRPDPVVVRRLREERLWTQEQLAESARVSLRTVQRIEKGLSVAASSLRSVADSLEVDHDRLRRPSGRPARWASAIAVCLVAAVLLAVAASNTGGGGEVRLYGVMEPPGENDLPEDLEDAMWRMTTIVHDPATSTKHHVGDDWKVQACLYLGTYEYEIPNPRTKAPETLIEETYLALATYRVDDATVATAGLMRRQTCFDDYSYAYRRLAGGNVSPEVRVPVTVVTTNESLGAEHMARLVMGWVHHPGVDQFTVKFSDGRSATVCAGDHRYFVGVLDRARRPASPSSLFDLQQITVTQIVAYDRDGNIID